jgi:3-oxoacyl-[acyl-carrier protein] reductase
MTIKPDLKGHTALVTGASRGIGAAIAIALAEAGAAIAVNYRERADEADAVVAKIRNGGGRAIAVAADVSQAAAVTAMLKHVAAELGPIDILVNNAGSLVQRMKLLETTEARWDEIMNLNLKSAMLCSQAVAKSMMDRKSGAIINVVSIAGRNGGGPGAGAYSAAKGAGNDARFHLANSDRKNWNVRGNCKSNRVSCVRCG